MVQLTESRSEDIAAYRGVFIREYVADLIKNHHLNEREANEKAVNAFNQAFPHGKSEKNNTLFRITKSRGNESCHAGYIWLLFSPESHSVFVMDFYIFPEYRQRQIGFAALKELMSLLEKADYREIKLRVEPDNQAAISLYCKIGFDVTGINMARAIGETGREDDSSR